MKIRGKLLLGYVGPVLLLAAPLLFLSLKVAEIYREFGAETSKTISMIDLLHGLQADAVSLPTLSARRGPALPAVVARMDGNLAAYRRMVFRDFSSEQPLLREIEESFARLRASVAPGGAGKDAPAAAATRFHEALAGAIRIETAEFESERNELLSGLSRTMTATLAFVAAALLLAFGVMFLVSKRISDRIASLDRAFAAARDGELAQPLAVAGGDELGALAASFNAMTAELRRRAQALVEAKELAESRNRFKTEFLANMSHEIRTPINSILGMLDELRFHDLPVEQRRLLDVANRSAETLLHIIDEILDLSRIEAGRTEVRAKAFDLGDSVRHVAEMFVERARRKGIVLSWDVDPAACGRVTGDSFRVCQVLLNLVGNAIKFTDAGSVRLRVLPDEEAAGERRTVRFEVRDTGIGVPPEVQLRIFEPFAQADGSTTRRYGGAGLGLAISKKLVDLMGGRIGVESAAGAGSLFWFTVPFGIAPAAGKEPSAPPASLAGALAAAAPRGRFRKILLAEDNPDNQAVMTQMLARLGLGVDVASTGQEAVDRYAGGGYDMVLMDYHMPVMNGIDAVRRIRERFPADRTPILALTADVFEGCRADCIAAGMDDFLAKPLRFHELQAAVERWLPAVPPGRPAGR